MQYLGCVLKGCLHFWMCDCWHLPNLTAPASLFLTSGQAEKRIRMPISGADGRVKTYKPKNTCQNLHPNSSPPDHNKNPKLDSLPCSQGIFQTRLKKCAFSPKCLIMWLINLFIYFWCIYLDIFVSRYQSWYLNQFGGGVGRVLLLLKSNHNRMQCHV